MTELDIFVYHLIYNVGWIFFWLFTVAFIGYFLLSAYHSEDEPLHKRYVKKCTNSLYAGAILLALLLTAKQVYL